MAASRKGKAVKQEDLRRLMQETRRDSGRQKRVESPFARYSGAGLLTCALCDAPVKNALLWQTHVLGKQHKDKLQELKSRTAPAQTPARTPAPSPSSSSSSSVLKRAAEPPPPAPGKRAKLQTGAGLGLLAGHYDDDDDEDEDQGGAGEGKTAPPTDSALPADFFDSGPAPPISHSGSVSKAEQQEAQEPPENRPEALPEGFFDDPVRDAQVRQVDTPKDQLEREWEEFQKEMRQVNSASDAIVAEDDEEGRLERQMDEIEEQMQCLRRVEELRAKQETARSRRRSQRREEEESMQEEELLEEEEELMHILTQDWRAKGALA